MLSAALRVLLQDKPITMIPRNLIMPTNQGLQAQRGHLGSHCLTAPWKVYRDFLRLQGLTDEGLASLRLKVRWASHHVRLLL